MICSKSITYSKISLFTGLVTAVNLALCAHSAASGMGLAGTELLVKDGWCVTMFDFNDEGAKVAAGLGDQVLFVQGNALVYDDQARAFQQTWRKWGRIDVGKFFHSSPYPG
jgi:hypothetical protein